MRLKFHKGYLFLAVLACLFCYGSLTAGAAPAPLPEGWKLTDERDDGKFRLYYDGTDYYSYSVQTDSSVKIDIGGDRLSQDDFDFNYVFMGDSLVRTWISYTYGQYAFFDPETGKESDFALDLSAMVSTYDEQAYHAYQLEDFFVYPETGPLKLQRGAVGISWYEPGQNYVLLSTVEYSGLDETQLDRIQKEKPDFYISREDTWFYSEHYPNLDTALWLDFFDRDGTHVRSVRLPFDQGYYLNYSHLILQYELLHLWGEYALFYDFPNPWGTEERIVCYHIKDGTYWYLQGEMFRAIKDRIVVINYDRDEYGGNYLQAELYAGGERRSVLWVPIPPEHVGGGGWTIRYDYARDQLNMGCYIFDFE